MWESEYRALKHWRNYRHPLSIPVPQKGNLPPRPLLKKRSVGSSEDGAKRRRMEPPSASDKSRHCGSTKHFAGKRRGQQDRDRRTKRKSYRRRREARKSRGSNYGSSPRSPYSDPGSPRSSLVAHAAATKPAFLNIHDKFFRPEETLGLHRNFKAPRQGVLF